MKSCNGCKFANWYRTAAGKLHPNGDGTCGYDYRVPQLPTSMYWLGNAPTPSGGAINRRKELSDHCPYWSRGEPRS